MLRRKKITGGLKKDCRGGTALVGSRACTSSEELADGDNLEKLDSVQTGKDWTCGGAGSKVGGRKKEASGACDKPKRENNFRNSKAGLPDERA